VATTGSTIAKATKTLLKAGASRVDALVLALRTADFFNPDQIATIKQGDGSWH
jgi:phosphoribosylpyrophosphate synthetase